MRKEGILVARRWAGDEAFTVKHLLSSLSPLRRAVRGRVAIFRGEINRFFRHTSRFEEDFSDRMGKSGSNLSAHVV